MGAWNFAARGMMAVVGAAVVAIVSTGFLPEARADDRDRAGSSSGSASRGGAASSGTGSTASTEAGSSQAPRMTPSAVGKMSPAEQMQMMDKDNKGYVTKEEFLKFQEKLWNNVPKSKADRVTEQEWLNQIHSGP